MPQDALPSGDISVRGKESAPGGVVIAGLEVIEAGFLVINVPTVTQGIQRTDVF